MAASQQKCRSACYAGPDSETPVQATKMGCCRMLLLFYESLPRPADPNRCIVQRILSASNAESMAMTALSPMAGDRG